MRSLILEIYWIRDSLREAIVNFVALLGWSPSDNQEIMSLPELVEKFDYHHMSKSPAVFDFTKA